jgi:hypothetical protein
VLQPVLLRHDTVEGLRSNIGGKTQVSNGTTAVGVVGVAPWIDGYLQRLRRLNHQPTHTSLIVGLSRQHFFRCRTCLHQGTVYEETGKTGYSVSEMYGSLGDEAQCTISQQDLLMRLLK